MRTISLYSQTLFLLLVLSLLSISLSAQNETFKLNSLSGKTWIMQGLTDKTYEESYSKDKITSYFNIKYTASREYYLSDSIVMVFDSSKVGSVDCGKFIVARILRNKDYPEQPLRVLVYEIIELSPDKLIMRNIKNPQLLEFKSK
jgi:hypothetical protein